MAHRAKEEKNTTFSPTNYRLVGSRTHPCGVRRRTCYQIFPSTRILDACRILPNPREKHASGAGADERDRNYNLLSELQQSNDSHSGKIINRRCKDAVL